MTAICVFVGMDLITSRWVSIASWYFIEYTL